MAMFLSSVKMLCMLWPVVVLCACMSTDELRLSKDAVIDIEKVEESEIYFVNAIYNNEWSAEFEIWLFYEGRWISSRYTTSIGEISGEIAWRGFGKNFKMYELPPIWSFDQINAMGRHVKLRELDSGKIIAKSLGYNKDLITTRSIIGIDWLYPEKRSRNARE